MATRIIQPSPITAGIEATCASDLGAPGDCLQILAGLGLLQQKLFVNIVMEGIPACMHLNREDAAAIHTFLGNWLAQPAFKQEH